MAEENNSNVTEEQAQDQQQQTEGDSTESKEKTFTQAELDDIVEKRVAREKKKAEQKAKDAAAEAEKLAKMNREQKADYEREKLEKELERYRKREARLNMKNEAKKLFKESNVDSSDELLELVTADTFDQTQENVEAFTTILNDMVETAVKDRLYSGSPKSFTNGGSAVTRESIEAIEDPAARQRAIAENLHLFR
ncbi:DUF4355 domain-containing protein [Staphylococcus delphini]|uniref:DUF4355 domain-containing protein n=1 Tax=Staphylococcus delphini TaxID=53344 RepID=UPI000BBB9B6E|nr:DUF4355 domain-containing protein [Staphylococcus delphini]PCF40114.1 hypothetical protein B5B99_03040 [Staphylococcus delphini]PCF45497.1 hypothetical protein B5B98_07315 [Staphylococcus delphini]PCF53881.1 hypothetical protein B5C03_01050 [Staphylococcus delphini]PCF59043.1 hypothetical protein B5B97_01170 [Staphylococcus delphini]PCF60336.1 hypothetical protein B5C05_03960 [Staphylococcus delphini]